MVDTQRIASLISPYRRHIWLIAAPKSGSTWLGAMLLDVLKWPRVPLLDCYDRREQEVDVRMLLQHPNEDIFTPHQHTRASQPTLSIIRLFRMIPMISVRNIFDSIISVRDHLYRETPIIPMAYFDQAYFELGEADQLSALVDLWVPWYFNFYVSWYKAEAQGLCDLHWVTYEALVKDAFGSVKRALQHAGVSRPDEDIRRAVDASKKQDTRKNVGQTGRGESALSDAHKERVRRLTRYYPDVDFSRIGL